MSVSFGLTNSAIAPAPAPAPEPKESTIMLRSSDGQVFTVDKTLAMEFGAVKRFLEEFPEFTGTSKTEVPIPNASSKYLSLAVTYCTNMLALKEDLEAKNQYEKKFLEGLRNMELKGLILVANFLDVKYLLEALNLVAADRIKDKSVEYVRKFFEVDNDYTPEEEAKLREENVWAFEDVNVEEYMD